MPPPRNPRYRPPTNPRDRVGGGDGAPPGTQYPQPPARPPDGRQIPDGRTQDTMGWNQDRQAVADRYAQAGQTMAGYGQQAASAVADRAALVGGAQNALQEQQARMGAGLQSTMDATSADANRWNAWWNVVPGSDYERLLALGRVAQQLYARRRSGSRRRSGGGSQVNTFDYMVGQPSFESLPPVPNSNPRGGPQAYADYDYYRVEAQNQGSQRGRGRKRPV